MPGSFLVAVVESAILLARWQAWLLVLEFAAFACRIGNFQAQLRAADSQSSSPAALHVANTFALEFAQSFGWLDSAVVRLRAKYVLLLLPELCLYFRYWQAHFSKRLRREQRCHVDVLAAPGFVRGMEIVAQIAERFLCLRDLVVTYDSSFILILACCVLKFAVKCIFRVCNYFSRHSTSLI